MYVLIDPNDVEPFSFVWLAEVGTSTILTNVWSSVPTGLTFSNEAINNTAGIKKTTAYVTGGTAGQDYRIINRITFDTTTKEQSFDVRVENR